MTWKDWILNLFGEIKFNDIWCNRQQSHTTRYGTCFGGRKLSLIQCIHVDSRLVNHSDSVIQLPKFVWTHWEYLTHPKAPKTAGILWKARDNVRFPNFKTQKPSVQMHTSNRKVLVWPYDGLDVQDVCTPASSISCSHQLPYSSNNQTQLRHPTHHPGLVALTSLPLRDC